MISFYVNNPKHICILFFLFISVFSFFSLYLYPLLPLSGNHTSQFSPLSSQFSYGLLSPSMYCDISRWSPS